MKADRKGHFSISCSGVRVLLVSFGYTPCRDEKELTGSGKRLFKQWLQAPLREIDAINARLDAVDDLIKYASFTGKFTSFAKNLPDLEVSGAYFTQLIGRLIA